MSDWEIWTQDFRNKKIKDDFRLECSSNVVQNLIQQQMAAHLHLLHLLKIFNSSFT